MPWVRRTHETHRFYWIIAGVTAVLMGILAGYSWWGDRAALVGIVERQLGQSEAEVRKLERRVKAIEEKLGLDEGEAQSASAVAY